MNFADRKADAARGFNALGGGLQEIASMRQTARANGWEMPDDVRQMIERTRRQLHDAGLPWETIDATPGLEPVE